MVHVDLRGVALCTWVAAFAHVLVLVQGVESWTAGSVALVASCLAGALPAIWGASVLLFAPGDANAALDVLLGRTHAGSPSSTSQREARSRDASPEASSARGRRLTSPPASAATGKFSDDDGDAEALAREMDSTVSARRTSDASPSPSSPPPRDVSPVYAASSLFSQHVSPTPSRKTSGELGKANSERAREPCPSCSPSGKSVGRSETFPGPRNPIPSMDNGSSRGSGSFHADPRLSQNSLDRRSRGRSMDVRRSDFGFDDQHSLNVQRRRLSLDTIRAWNVFESDDSSDNDDKGTEEGWQDAITGIRGMAQALCDANNSVATVSLNADLTVSLSNLMLNTLKLFDPTGEKGGDGAEDARVLQLEDPHAMVKKVCTLSEPLFDTGCPLVLYNRFKPGELSFVPRDTFECCLFALLYRAGTRVLDGDCVMTTEKISADEMAKGDSGGSGGSGGSGDAGLRGRPSLDSVASARERQGERKEKEEGHALRVLVEYRTATRLMSKQELNATELRFWKRRLKRVGGSLKFEQVNVGMIGSHTERIIMMVPTAGSNTFLAAEKQETGARIGVPGVGYSDSPKIGSQSLRSSRASSANAGMSLREGQVSRAGSLRSGAAAVPSPGDSSRGGLALSELSGYEGDLAVREASGVSGSTAEESMREEQMDLFDAEDGEPGANLHRHRRLRHPLGDLSEEGSGSMSQVTDSGSSLDFVDNLFMLTAGQLDFKILYIEDERVQAYFFINKCRRVFGDRCVVVHETDGIAALERLKSGEQYTVIVSDVFMSRMDGVSFFHTLFSANLNTGNLVPEGLSERELRMNIILTGADGDDISADLEQVRSLYGVLAYNKTSSIDVVGDVIKPHISFVESRLRDVIRRGHNGGWPSSVGSAGGVGASAKSSSNSAADFLAAAGIGGEFLRSRRSKRASERSADGSFSLASVGGDSFSLEHSPLGAPPPPVQATDSWRSTNSSLGAKASKPATGPGPRARDSDARGTRDPVDHGDHWEGAGTAYNLISRSNTSLGKTSAKPFPDTTNIRRAVAGIDDD